MAPTLATAKKSTGGRRIKVRKALTSASKTRAKMPARTKKSGGNHYKPGSQSLRVTMPLTLEAIKGYQKSTDLLIDKTPFHRLVKEIILDQTPPEMRFPASTIEGLQEMAEGHLVGLFANANLQAILANRVTVQAKDMRLAGRIAEEKEKEESSR
ncbi:histone H3.1 [Exophiala sideris]|uniref:Histone H3 n=1 Tax=Exophiala sideris TaxID=1016849 RepID=A0ABR0J896_9EURO|nr:histone H3.1 [Exophiala sideris]KAK5058282.1 histone H3.1 [Exophiala sideris]KAK5180211.1 histone H3.1 [Eurotiomycetes sp. CCFEE 6388]